MSEGYPWYSIVSSDDPIEQGDFLPDFPVLIPPRTILPGTTQEVEGELIDAIVMTQSCDIPKKSVKRILVCPFYSLEAMSDINKILKRADERESLRRGNYYGYHLLKNCETEGFESDILVVDFRNVSGVDKEHLFEFVKEMGDRKRLMSPYKEHLSQAFARFFMRVGLPVDIPPFE